MLHFAYGPLMERASMKRLCKESHFRSAARLHGYQLIFPRRSDLWGGGMAGLKSAQARWWRGSLYEVGEADHKILDQVEDHPRLPFASQSR